jgi:hypothetical protein
MVIGGGVLDVLLRLQREQLADGVGERVQPLGDLRDVVRGVELIGSDSTPDQGSARTEVRHAAAIVVGCERVFKLGLRLVWVVWVWVWGVRVHV